MPAGAVSQGNASEDLVVVVEVTTAGSQEGRSALIQTKMARATERVSPCERAGIVQLDLYQN